MQKPLLKRLAAGYLEHVRLVGALYCLIPTLVGFGLTFALVPFRAVYVLRLLLSVAAGLPFAAFVNRFGLRLWLYKHASADGPSTAVDGFFIGGATGFGTALIPSLTNVIGMQHPEKGKTVMIATWLGATVIGAVWGAVLGFVGARHVPRGERCR